MSELQAGVDAFNKGNYGAAMDILAALAEQGDPTAQHLVGVMYAGGWAVNRDYKTSFKWLSLAADQGHPQAQGALGEHYEFGQGVPKDYAKAAEWYRRGAAQGECMSMFRLGGLHRYGQGMATDLVQAYKWFMLATENGFDGSTSSRLMIERQLTAEQIAEATKLAGEWHAVPETASV